MGDKGCICVSCQDISNDNCKCVIIESNPKQPLKILFFCLKESAKCFWLVCDSYKPPYHHLH